jgi:hypothetical protein
VIRRPIKLKTMGDFNRSNTYYDAASQEFVTVTTDKLKIWLEDCQVEFLKDKCNFFNSISNFIAVLGIFITLVTTLYVTNFNSELWKAIYIVLAGVILLILLAIGSKCIIARRNRSNGRFSECIIKKIKENSIVSQGEDG